LQALVDKKRVVVTEAAIRNALHLDDAEGVDCLPNEEIFTELARMGYEKPTTKLTFYKAFFSSQWKFLIHTILQSMSAKRTSWNEFSSAMASVVICLSTDRKFNFSKYIFESLDSSTKFYMYPRFINLIIQKQLGDLSTHSTKYISPALTQKVFANMRRVGKGCSGVETPLFEGMLVAREPEEQGDVEEQCNKEEQGNADTIAEEPETAVPEDAANDQPILSPTSLNPPLQQPQDEAVEVVTTAKLITEVIAAVSETISVAAVIPSARRNHLQKLLLKPPPRTKEKVYWAYFDGFVTEPERRPRHLNRQNHYEVPSESYRDFQEQKSGLDQMMKQGQNIFEKMKNYLEELNVDTRANKEPIITDQHYGISDLSGFQSIQGGPSSFQTPTNNFIFNMGTPTNWQTSLSSQPGSSNWFTDRRVEINNLMVFHDHPLIDYGKYAIGCMTGAEMKKCVHLKSVRDELLRSMEEKRQLMINYRDMSKDYFLTPVC
nr:hypothetical protein [Tanacetum cinerariifolium]